MNRRSSAIIALSAVLTPVIKNCFRNSVSREVLSAAGSLNTALFLPFSESIRSTVFPSGMPPVNSALIRLPARSSRAIFPSLLTIRAGTRSPTDIPLRRAPMSLPELRVTRRELLYPVIFILQISLFRKHAPGRVVAFSVDRA